MNELEKCAEILVECEYADGFWGNGYFLFYNRSFENETKLDPFSDTLEGRRQADAIEDWLSTRQSGLWCVFSRKDNPLLDNLHKWRLDRIKWCIQELIK